MVGQRTTRPLRHLQPPRPLRRPVRPGRGRNQPGDERRPVRVPLRHRGRRPHRPQREDHRHRRQPGSHRLGSRGPGSRRGPDRPTVVYCRDCGACRRRRGPRRPAGDSVGPKRKRAQPCGGRTEGLAPHRDRLGTTTEPDNLGPSSKGRPCGHLPSGDGLGRARRPATGDRRRSRDGRLRQPLLAEPPARRASPGGRPGRRGPGPPPGLVVARRCGPDL